MYRYKFRSDFQNFLSEIQKIFGRSIFFKPDQYFKKLITSNSKTFIRGLTLARVITL